MPKKKSVPNKVVLISHDGLAEGLKNTAEMIMGAQENLYAFGLQRGEHPDEIIAQVEKLIEPGERMFILGDLAGGSVCNAALRLTTREQVALVAGMNLPLVIQFLISVPDSLEGVEKTISEARKNLKALVLKRPATDEEGFF